MRSTLLPVIALLFVLPLGGCMDVFGGGKATPDAKPVTHEYDMFVNAASNEVVGLYPRNDNSSQDALAITFKASPDDPQSIPGPEIRVKEGDTVIIHLHNPNGLSHTLHLHGGLIPWEMDGVDYLTQFPVMKGEDFDYTFTNLKAGTYWYHCHMDGAHHIDFGMYGAFIVEERHPAIHYDRDYVVFLDEYDSCHAHGNFQPLPAPAGEGQEPSADANSQSDCTYRWMMDYLAQNQALQAVGTRVNDTVPDTAQQPACDSIAMLPDSQEKTDLQTAFGCLEHVHSNPPQQTPRAWWYETNPLYNPTYNTFLINGKAFPDTPVFPVKQGETVRFRLINAGNLVHTWHLHGHTMLITHKDGYPLDSPYKADTIAIAPGERYDFVVKADNPGLWMIHDQMGQYTDNDNVHPGGMMACMAYDGFHGVDAFAMTKAIDCNHEGVRILEEMGQMHHHGGMDDMPGMDPASTS